MTERTVKSPVGAADDSLRLEAKTCTPVIIGEIGPLRICLDGDLMCTPSARIAVPTIAVARIVHRVRWRLTVSGFSVVILAAIKFLTANL